MLRKEVFKQGCVIAGIYVFLTLVVVFLLNFKEQDEKDAQFFAVISA